MSNRKKIAAITVIPIVAILLISSIPAGAEKQFVIAAWDYPDEYGQGIEGIAIYENSTGSWLLEYVLQEWDLPHVYEWPAGVAIRLRIWSFFNSTLTEAGDTDEGKNLQRHYVEVVNLQDEVVFSQQNITFHDVVTILDPMWYYGYQVVLEFIPEFGQIYTVTIIYEIFW